MKDVIIIGEVVGVHGVRGEIKVNPLTDDPGRFYELDKFTLKLKNLAKEYQIELVRMHKGQVLLSLSGIRSREEAEKLKGGMICIRREEAVDLEEDEYFITDLIGLKVLDQEGLEIGKVKDVLQTTGSVDTLEIKTSQKMIYIPFRKIYFPEIDFSSDEIHACIPDDLMAL